MNETMWSWHGIFVPKPAVNLVKEEKKEGETDSTFIEEWNQLKEFFDEEVYGKLKAKDKKDKSD